MKSANDVSESTMSNLNPDPFLDLPLSWARTSTSTPLLNRIELPYAAEGWIPTAEIPYGVSFKQVYRDYLKRQPNGLVFQSARKPLRDFLMSEGFQAAPMGVEAILDLPWRGKRSVRELARRGRRHGEVREIEVSGRHQEKLARLRAASSSRQGVQLRHTEREMFDDSTRCFAFEAADGQWLGAITLSENSPEMTHTELLLRHQDAPVGIMEALVTAIAAQLTREGVQQFSLGAVTPVPDTAIEDVLAPSRHPDEQWLRGQLFLRLGRWFNFAYNAQGLYRFKNKFSPRWEPLYLCASPRLTWATLASLLQVSGYMGLVKQRLLNLWSRPLPIPSPGRLAHRPISTLI